MNKNIIAPLMFASAAKSSVQPPPIPSSTDWTMVHILIPDIDPTETLSTVGTYVNRIAFKQPAPDDTTPTTDYYVKVCSGRFDNVSDQGLYYDYDFPCNWAWAESGTKLSELGVDVGGVPSETGFDPDAEDASGRPLIFMLSDCALGPDSIFRQAFQMHLNNSYGNSALLCKRQV